MPGPHPLANLVEFFWKDGFGRIHEIQVAEREGSGGGAQEDAREEAPRRDFGEGAPGQARKGTPRRGAREGL